jgi:acyl dehydratase
MTERLSKTVASSDVVGFAQLTGDRNPIHLSEHFAAKTSFGRRIAHGLYTASLISAVLGTRLPGPGAIYISQTLNFRAPVKIGDTVEVTVTVAELLSGKIAGAAVLHLRGRRGGSVGRRGAGEGSERKSIQGKAAADAVIAGQKSAVITARRWGRARRGLLGLA